MLTKQGGARRRRKMNNAAMDVKETRRRNWKRLVAEHDKNKLADTAKRMHKSPSQISHLIGGHPTKGIGHTIARQVEAAYSMPRGWLDVPHDARPEPAPALEAGPEIQGEFRRAPLVGTAQLGTDGYWCELEYPAGEGDGWIDVPSRDPNAYTLRVRGDSMTPAIRNGWLVVIEPNRELIPGEYVMLCLRDGRCMVKELLFERADLVSVSSVNDEHERMTFPREEVEKMHYVGFVVPPSKLRI